MRTNHHTCNSAVNYLRMIKYRGYLLPSALLVVIHISPISWVEVNATFELQLLWAGFSSRTIRALKYFSTKI
jgi:hypothetical protein